MTQTSIVIGSKPSVPATSITVTANAVLEVLSFPAGDYYLRHTGIVSQDLLDALTVTLNTHSELTDVLAFLVVDGHVRLTASVAFAVDGWGASNVVRDLVGFITTLASSTSHLAPEFSPLYWSPGRRPTWLARIGADGAIATDTQVGRAAPGVVVATRHNEWKVNRASWTFVKFDRFQTIAISNGTWELFWRDVVSRYRRLFVYLDVFEDTTDDTTAMVLGARVPSTGAYIKQNTGEAETMAIVRDIAKLDIHFQVDLRVETALGY